jgi:hypothetical protein
MSTNPRSAVAANSIIEAVKTADAQRYNSLAILWADPLARALLAMAEENKRLRASLGRFVADFGDVCDEGDMEAKAVIAEARSLVEPSHVD